MSGTYLYMEIAVVEGDRCPAPPWAATISTAPLPAAAVRSLVRAHAARGSSYCLGQQPLGGSLAQV